MSDSVLIQPMFPGDVPLALKMIYAHDEDDGEAAEESYESSLENQFCLKVKDRLVGVTGFRREGKDVAWLSWHYVQPKLQGKGWGEVMLKQVMAKVAEHGVRKMFISTSDYRESPSVPMLYAGAIALYEKEGFERECYHADYFEKGEGEIVYGKRVRPPDMGMGVSKPVPVRLFEAELIDETDSAFFIDWEECEEGERFTIDDLNAIVFKTTKAGATAIFVSFPSTMSEGVQALLSQGGFQEDGVLRDYHADGIHEIRYRRNV